MRRTTIKRLMEWIDNRMYILVTDNRCYRNIYVTIHDRRMEHMLDIEDMIGSSHFDDVIVSVETLLAKWM
jgi:hypothetical protein